MFSYFTNHAQNFPIGSLTISELHRQLVNPDQEPFAGSVDIVRGLRLAHDEDVQGQIKGYLPAFTPSAMVDTKKAAATASQKNIRFSGYMQIDIDAKDNPNMKDAEAIRNKLAQIPYIALSAISARGRGVWGLLALQEPDKFTEYTEQVYHYFKRARVNIDPSKSKNPTELRYFSPDAGAILKQKYELMPLEPVKPKPQPTTTATTTKATGSTLAELMKWVNQRGYSLIDGQKHMFIYWLSYALRKNGASEADVYSIIHSIISPDRIKSNCIVDGIKAAEKVGIYKPTQSPHPSGTPYNAKLTPSTNFEKQTPKKYIPLPPPADVRHNYIGTDSLLHIHYPGLPE